MTKINLKKAWQVIATTRELKNKPFRAFYNGLAIVLFRDKHSIKALRDQCPHRGIPLSEGCVRSGKINCCYHGWQFTGEGELAKMPGNPEFSRLTQPIVESFDAIDDSGLIWVRTRQTKDEVCFIPEIHDTHSYATISIRVNARSIDVIENFLDPLHTHTIHSGIIRSKNKKRHACNVTISNIDNGYQAEYVEEQKQSGLLSKLFGQHIIKSVGRVRYPGIVEVEYYSTSSIELSVVIYVNQETSNRCKLIIRTYLKRGLIPFMLKALVLAPLQYITLHQDKRILEIQHKCHLQNPDFKPVITKTDIMRPYIEKALRYEVIPVNEQLQILL